MKTELVDLKLAEWSRTVGMAMIERRATVKELIEAAVSYVGDDLMRIALAHAEQKTGLTYGKNKRAGDDREHMEWHAKCGCAYHPEPFPHVHPCSDAHKRPDLHAGSQEEAPEDAGLSPEWAVSVEVGGREILSLGHNWQYGDSRPNPAEIRRAAEHLLAFIGDPKP